MVRGRVTLQLISGAFEHSVLCIMLFVRPIDCSIKHHIFKSINFQYTQHGMFKRTCMQPPNFRNLPPPPPPELAGKKEMHNYQTFISEYADQLRKIEDALDETVGEAWDFNLDPIALQVGVAVNSVCVVQWNLSYLGALG